MIVKSKQWYTDFLGKVSKYRWLIETTIGFNFKLRLFHLFKQYKNWPCSQYICLWCSRLKSWRPQWRSRLFSHSNGLYHRSDVRRTTTEVVESKSKNSTWLQQRPAQLTFIARCLYTVMLEGKCSLPNEYLTERRGETKRGSRSLRWVLSSRRVELNQVRSRSSAAAKRKAPSRWVYL